MWGGVGPSRTPVFLSAVLARIASVNRLRYSPAPMNNPSALALDLLTRWLDWAERYWRPLDNGRGVWGTGYEHWGVQSHQKYVAAAAVVAALERANPPRRDRALARALAGLRWTLDNHISGPGHCADGTQWGHSWISALGIVLERGRLADHGLPPRPRSRHPRLEMEPRGPQ